MELAEATISDKSVTRGATTVELTAFGVYARSLEGVGVRPGDYLAIKNPRVMEWDGKENRVQIFVGLKEQDLGQRIAVLRGVEDALREVSSIGSNTVSEEQECPAVSNPSTSPPKSPPAAQVPVPVPVPSKPGTKVYSYTKLKDCLTLWKGAKYNAWAVVISVSKQPGPTKGKKLMGQVYIRDPGFTGSQGKADMQFSLLADDESHFPPLVEGSTMRIHSMAMQEFNGERTGRVYDARSVVVIKNDGVDKDKFEPESGVDPAKLTFNEEDLFFAKQMRQFWQGITAASSGAAEKRGEEDSRSPIIMSSVATNTTITQEEEAAMAEELGMNELLEELRKSPEKEKAGNSNQKSAAHEETEDVFTDSTLFREAAEQLDAAAASAMPEVPAVTVPGPTRDTQQQDSSFEWVNSTAPSVASQETEAGDSCPVFKQTFPQMTMDVIELPKSPVVHKASASKSTPMTRSKSRTMPRVPTRTTRGRKQVADDSDGGAVAPKKSSSTREALR